MTSVGDASLWYKDAIVYELHVRAFYDSNGDGIGDFDGLAARLDYLEDLGVTAIWLLPFYPSPLRDDGYDIADYFKINPIYGDMASFKAFLREAHARGIKVVTELVLNHTSDQHPWFQAARKAPAGSPKRDFYVWHDSPEKYRAARIIFRDFEPSNWSWDGTARAYYWHRFYSHQPDLNFDNPEVRKALLRVVDFWFGMGVDGMRLDAVPYLYEREGTNCENLPETHAFLKELRRHVDSRYENRMLLAEANQWPEDAVAYFGAGDECHMNFHFPLMPRMFMALSTADRFPIVDILDQTPAIPDTCQWAMFLRNHDELTLEMVTDEERDYMYRVYAHDQRMRINLGIRRRLAPLCQNDRRRIELLNVLLCSMPGTPVIYYGDEIGMGDNIYLGDRNGVRTPLQWSPDRNAGFSVANPQGLFLPVSIDPEYHYEAVNIEVQRNNPQSLFWWMKRLLALRNHTRAFGRGTIEFLHPENRHVLVFVRTHENERVLVVANLADTVQYVELDLTRFRGVQPTEMFGRTRFPAIGDLPYFLTLAPYGYYWFDLGAPVEAAVAAGEAPALPQIEVPFSWHDAVRGDERERLERILPAYLSGCRWFAGKAKTMEEVRVRDAVPLSQDGNTWYVLLVTVEYADAEPETYIVTVAFASGIRAEEIVAHHRPAVIARIAVPQGSAAEAGVLYDAIIDRAFGRALAVMLSRKRTVAGSAGELVSMPVRRVPELRGPATELPDPVPSRAEQSNSSLIYGDKLTLKLFRRVEPGINPEVEIGRYLADHKGYTGAAPLAGALEYAPKRGERMTVAMLQGFVVNEGDAWQYTLGALHRYFDRSMTLKEFPSELTPPALHPLELTGVAPPQPVTDTIGPYLELTRILARRTAELHTVLASNDHPDFTPEPFNPMYQRSLFQSLRNLTTNILPVLRKRAADVPEAMRPSVRRLLQREADILARFRTIVGYRSTAVRTRCHGDYHLGQVLFTGKDFVIIDFEGEPARPLSDRRRKACPLRDIAGMLRSFHYAALSALHEETGGGRIAEAQRAAAEQWANFWYLWVSATFLRTYFEHADAAGFLPRESEERKVLLDAFLLEKSLYELRYELNNRPAWVWIPLRGIATLLGGEV